MVSYLLRRFLVAIPLILGVSTIVFIVLHLAPGDPTQIYLNPDIDQQLQDQIRHNLGLDQPIHLQYLRWLGSFLTGDFGYSLTQHRPVSSILASALPHTLILSLASLVIIFGLGIVTGTISAVRQHGVTDHVTTIVTLFFYSVPTFWLALMFILLFSEILPVLPSAQAMSINYDSLSLWGRVVDRFRHLILPSLALGLGGAAGIARFARGSMLEALSQDYIRTARAKGLPERTVICRHALRNALIPVITLLGLYLPFLFSGAVLVETVFSWPGMGRVIVTAILQRDYPVVMANTFLFGVMVLLGNLLADVLYCLVDPRIRYARRLT
ncbi:MAG: ABC transporter permease [Candidatus Eisenbacteria sp.]|nr:ABC transporter permease [Candidatus Eisenbacteria bacterium]